MVSLFGSFSEGGGFIMHTKFNRFPKPYRFDMYKCLYIGFLFCQNGHYEYSLDVLVQPPKLPFFSFSMR